MPRPADSTVTREWAAVLWSVGGSDDYGQATPPTGSFSQVSAGEAHSCGYGVDSTLSCWGYNASGQAPPPLLLNPESLPRGAVDVPLDAALVASGGSAPSDYAVIDGALLDGLSRIGTGQLVGSLSGQGSFDFSVQATDALPIPLFGRRSHVATIHSGLRNLRARLEGDAGQCHPGIDDLVDDIMAPPF